jgi:NAD(P)-dependent dehydrogenase (short-subunit alcohol dehydrogenase family)
VSDDGAPSLRLEGHVYVVTGATGTLGRAVASALLARGARVAVPYRSPERWREVEPGLQGGDRVWAAAGDITDPASTVRFVEAAAQHFGRIDGLAAIAGAYSDSGRFEEAPVTEWLAMMGANLTPTFTGCRAVLPYLLERGGSVVTVTSRRALEMAAGATAYVVAKSAVLSLTRALAAENRDRGVRFNCVAPGIIDTPDNRAAMPHADLTRWTSPAALAEVIAFLLSPASAPVTGAVIPADLPA